LVARGRGRDTRSLEAAHSLSRVDACNPLLQAHPTWARDEHEGRGIPTSLTPVSGRLALPPSRSASRSTHLGWGTRRHSLVGSGTPRSRNADTTTQYFARKPPQTLEKLLQKMDEYIRADNDFRQRREEAYRFSEMTRGFGGRIHPRHVRSIHSSSQNDDKGSQLQRPQYTSQSLEQQQNSFRPPAPRGRGARSFRGRYGDQPRKVYCLFCGEDKGHTTRMCQITIQKQKEIEEAKARQNQPKQVFHTASCHSPYIPEYVGNHPAASIASASHSQASWPELPPPPPLQPTHSRSLQPKGRQHSQQQREFREESEARTVNSTVPESKHIY
jgi:hypothetical protein